MKKYSFQAFSAACSMLIVFQICQSPCCGDDWLHWRGPEQNGVSRELGLVSDWSLDPRKNVLWVSPIGGRATPVVLNDRVFLNCRTEHDVSDPEEVVHAGEQVVCWDAKTGEVIWRDVFNVFQTDIPAPRIGWASMCGDKETNCVYVHSISGLFRCYTADGEIVWERSLTPEFGKISGYGGRTQTPIIDENRVIVSFLAANWGDEKGPAPKHFYYAFDKRTGELLWASAPGGAPKDTNYSIPFVTVIDGQRLLIGGNSDGGLYAMQARTGKPVWGFQLALRGLNMSPVTDGKRIFISHGEDNIDNTEFGRVQCIDPTGSGDVTNTHGVWRRDGIKAGYSGLLVHDGILYVVADTGNLHALDSETGEDLWTHNLGTVGKGAPVWADGKLYVMEVNGNVHILKPSREGCETVSHVELKATKVEGEDEIYASPAISNGRVFLVTRDRTICLGSPDAEVKEEPAKELAPEKETSDEIATVQMHPYEVALMNGDEVEYSISAFDANGNFIKEITPESISLGADLAELSTVGNKLTATKLDHDVAGVVTATVGDLEARARVRVFNAEKIWSWDFEEFAPPTQVPPSWIRAHVKLKPEVIAGNTAMKGTGLIGGRERPSHNVWIGPDEMSNYTIQADVMMKEQLRRLADIGIVNQRYSLVLKGNTSLLEIQSWQPHLRLGARQPFVAEPDVWYTLKLAVDVSDGKANVHGKVWKQGDPEPADWTIDVVDPRANIKGSPGLYMYATADCYFDNVQVIQNK